MKVYTSYFKNAKYLNSKGYICVGISRFPPDDYKNNNLYIIAPSADLLSKIKNHIYNREQYKYAYLAQLRNTNIADICNAIEQVSINNDNKDVVLCCYEDPEDFCHRHIFAEWLNSFKLFGGDIHEWSAKDLYIHAVELF